MKILMSGASGFIGKNIVSELEDRKCECLLLGRDKALLNRLFPGRACFTYSELKMVKGYDLFVHLATLNNNVEASKDEFDEINIHFLLKLASLVNKQGNASFLNISSVYALNTSIQKLFPKRKTSSIYAESKRFGAVELSNKFGSASLSIFLPYVYGSTFTGKLKFLNLLPKYIADFIFKLVSSTIPVLSIEDLACYISEFKCVKGGDVVLVTNKDNDLVYNSCKRALDIFLAIIAGSITALIFFPISLMIKLDSAGRVIIAQERVGRQKKTFRCLKFRTMREGTSTLATHEVPVDSITRVGAFMRRLKIDELPQFWNVLKNDMSFIGPRPCLTSQTRLVSERDIRGIYNEKPGITGWSQINNVDMSQPIELARTDQEYRKMKSLSVDIRIILFTLFGEGFGDKTQQNK